MENQTLSELLQEFIEIKKLHFEISVNGLQEVAKALGYRGHQFANGSPLEEFLADNPGAQQAIIDWIGEQNIQDWKDNVESELPERNEITENDENYSPDELLKDEDCLEYYNEQVRENEIFPLENKNDRM